LLVSFVREEIMVLSLGQEASEPSNFCIEGRKIVAKKKERKILAEPWKKLLASALSQRIKRYRNLRG
jgi:hypothetical protein